MLLNIFNSQNIILLSTSKEFNFEQRIINHLILNSKIIDDLGLLEGKTGIAIAFYEYARYIGNDLFITFANELVDDVVNNLTTFLSDDFTSGICGIGWGLEYMIQNDFIEADSSDIIIELNETLMRKDIRRVNDVSLNGLTGLLHYVLIHSCNKAYKPFDDVFLFDLSCKIKEKKTYLDSNLVKKFDNYINSSQFTEKYEIDIREFIVDQKFSHEIDILNKKLGIKDGLSNYLIFKSLS